MVKIDLNIPFVNLDGKHSTDNESSTLGKIAGSTMAVAQEVDALKFFTWAQKFYNGQSIEVDESDFNSIQRFFESHKSLFVVAKAQILRALIDCKTESANKAKDASK